MKQAEFTIRPNVLGACVLVGALMWAALWIVVFLWMNSEEEVEPVPVAKRLTLPQKCAEFRREPDPDSWDPVTDTYPPNIEWENCMGVGRK